MVATQSGYWAGAEDLKSVDELELSYMFQLRHNSHGRRDYFIPGSANGRLSCMYNTILTPRNNLTSTDIYFQTVSPSLSICSVGSSAQKSQQE